MCPGGASNSSALKVVHRHGPCSPLRSRGAAPPSPVEILRLNRDRATSMLRKIAGAAAATNAARASKGAHLPAHWATATLGTNNYVVTVGLGTPARYFTVEFNTGSDLSWVQCEPCKDCYEQRDPLFDPAKSPTFSTVPCGARECRELPSQTCSPDNRCRFECAYADGSQTDGDLARDTLTLTPSDAIRGFVFGCGHQNSGFFGTEDGLLGLGRKSVSLSSQAAGRYGPGFSYCLPSLSSGTGYLALGGGAPANAQFTPMVPSRALPSLYFLRLTGIMVASKAVKVPAASMLIDSGTQLTSLPDGTFAALWSAFARLMTGRYRRAPGLSFLDTCYNFTGHAALQVPSVALVFAGGATVNLDVSGVLVKLGSDEPNVACLAFTSSGDDMPVGILGNTQQKTFDMVYDFFFELGKLVSIRLHLQPGHWRLGRK